MNTICALEGEHMQTSGLDSACFTLVSVLVCDTNRLSLTNIDWQAKYSIHLCFAWNWLHASEKSLILFICLLLQSLHNTQVLHVLPVPCYYMFWADSPSSSLFIMCSLLHYWICWVLVSLNYGCSYNVCCFFLIKVED